MTQALAVQNKKELAKGLDFYLQEIRKIPVLSREEEKKLAFQWFGTRDRDAGQKLVLSNLRFVVKIAKEYSRYGFRLADLIQEGNLGLLHALDKYDPRKGFRLISYAVWWIRAYVQAFILRSWSMVRMGTTRVQRRIISGLQVARRKIAAMNGGKAVEASQLAQALDVSEQDLSETLSRMQKRDQSLDAPLSRESDMTFGETLMDQTANPEETIIANELQEKVREKIDEVYETLSPRERYLLNHRLLSDTPATLESVGTQFNVTRERARQIEEKLKKKLRNVLSPTVHPTRSEATFA